MCSCARAEITRRRRPELADAVHGDRALQEPGPIPVYRRVRDPGIKFPEGLTYVGSWIEPNLDRCFQLMECDDLRLLQQWVLANNRDLGMTFEIVPVVPSKETREVVAPFLDGKK